MEKKMKQMKNKKFMYHQKKKKKIEIQKITNLLGTTINKVPKFSTKNG